VIDGLTFGSWADYFSSEYFQTHGKRCGTPVLTEEEIAELERLSVPSDCSIAQTVIKPEYNPVDIYEISVVVHIIMNAGGTGAISDALVQSQIDVLNEAFQALPGTPGEPGVDCRIRFKLATVDPDGNPTTGITRDTNTTWFNDGGSYWNSLAWDTHRYLNIYTNSAGGGGVLGYVPCLPAQGGCAGSISDRVVILWSAFGRPGQGGGQYDEGDTATHEVGHYLGMFHTFEGGCGTATPPGCYTTGDRICDTNSEANPRFSCTGSSCGSPDPILNYMDYTPDACMNQFTAEQCNRMRCTMINYRPDIYEVVGTTAVNDPVSGGRLFSLYQNRPNPFNPQTRISFELMSSGSANLEILDVNGRVVRTYAFAALEKGFHDVAWDGRDDLGADVASGAYFYRFQAAGQSLTRRMVLLK